MTWIVLGSSENAPADYHRARMDYPDAPVITTNAGILIEPRPDVALLIDSVGIRRWQEQYTRAALKGTHCVTINSDLPFFNEFLLISDSPLPERNRFARRKLSGPLCLQYAAMMATERVVLCGCAGYPSVGHGYFHGSSPVRNQRVLSEQYEEINQNVLEPYTQRLCDIWPELDFVCYGEPRYTIKAANWRVV